MIYDVIVIGAGTSGGMIARELSRYDLNIAILEKSTEAGGGTSKANSGIVHGGYNAIPGTLKAVLNKRGNEMMDEIALDLDVSFLRCGSLVVAFSDEDMETIEELYDRGVENRIKGLTIINRKNLKKLEPNLSEKALGALLCESAGIISPYELSVGSVENAVMNGTDVYFNTEVVDIDAEKDTIKVITNNGEFETKYLVNAAGVYGGKICGMYGEEVDIRPRKGEYLLYDSAMSNLVTHTIFQTPSKMGKGILVTPTVEGNMLLGPTSEDIDDKEDFATTREGLSTVIEKAKKSVPTLDLKGVITSFAGLRAVSPTEDFIIRINEEAKNIIDVIGIESPGLSSSPAIAEYTAELLKKAGLKMNKKKDFKSKNTKKLRFSTISDEDRRKAIERNKLYGNIVCRCEMVTKGEIVDAINRPAGATTLDGVKHRTRAGAGRCHGGFCSPTVMKILSEQMEVPFEQIHKWDSGSWIVSKKTKSE